jgi:solute:Na+ symporter, SSS family
MFRIIDLIVVIIFMLIMAGVGIYFSKKNNSTEEYFLGNRSFPGWVIGLSMLGTSISSITFLALPAAAFILDYRQAVPNLAVPFVALAAVLVFIPFFRVGKATSAFEYLEHRYGQVVRLYAASSFIVLQLLRLATVLYLVSIPIASMTGFNIIGVIIVAGIFIGFYTVLGGIDAVIWTDVVQTIVLLLGGIVCLGIIIYLLPGGLNEVIEVGSKFNKFSLGPINWGLDSRTFLVLFLLGIVNFTTEFSSNQNLVQRYLAAKSTREARKATIICAAMSIPTWLSFFFLGTCLFVFYKAFPTVNVAAMTADEVLPYFILTKTPPGVAGVIIAACLAAAMSSLDSSINAISTIITVDFVKRYGKTNNDSKDLKLARIFGVLAGGLMIIGAIIINIIPKESVNDLGLILSSIFGGGLLSLYMLGFFTKRVGNKAILIGLGAGLILNFYLMLNSFGLLPQILRCNVHSYWTTILVNLLLITVAYTISFFCPSKKNLVKLTVWTMKKNN